MASEPTDASVPLDIEAAQAGDRRSGASFGMCAKISCGLVAFLCITSILFVSTSWLDGIVLFFFANIQVSLITGVLTGYDEEFHQWLEVIADDALHVILVGTGSPAPDALRVGPCTVVMGGGKFFVFDSGDGSVNNMGVRNYPTGNITAAFFTHYHSDHIADLGQLMEVSWINGRTAPLDIYGPPGIDITIASLNTIYQFDQEYRSVHHTEKYMPSAAQPARAIEFDNPPEGGDGRVVYEQDEMKVTAFNIDHRPVYPAVGYKVEYKGRSVIISGDGKSGEEMNKQLKDSDIQIRNVLNEPWMVAARDAFMGMGDARNYRLGFMLNDTLDYHTYPIDVIRDTQEQNVKMGIMSHIIPAPQDWFQLKLLKAQNPLPWGFRGEIVWGQDGMHFKLPANSESIERVHTK